MRYMKEKGLVMFNKILGAIMLVCTVFLLVPIWTSYILLSLLFKLIPIPIANKINNLPKESSFTICKTLYLKGLLSEEQYETEKEIFNNTDKETVTGYIYMVFPITLYLQNFSNADKLLAYIVINLFQKSYKQQNIRIRTLTYFCHSFGTTINKLKSLVLLIADFGLLSILSAISSCTFIIWFLYATIPLVYILAGIPILVFILLFYESLGNGLTAQLPKTDVYMYIIYFLVVVVYLNTLWYVFSTTDPIYIIILKSAAAAILLGSLGYPILHELGHRSNKVSKILTYILSYILLMPTFTIFHNKGHHKELLGSNVDHATAKFNEGIITYLFRQLIVTSLLGLKIAKKRYIMLRALELAIVITLFSIEPLLAFTVLIIQFWSFIILETINYVEHYGVAKSKNLSNRSIDSVNLALNHAFFNVGYHSNHHTSPNTVCWSLEPTSKYKTNYGYIAQFYLAFLPKTWKFYSSEIVDNKFKGLTNDTRRKRRMVSRYERRILPR